MQEHIVDVAVLEPPAAGERTDRVTAEDGVSLAYRVWEPDRPVRDLAVVLHCIGFHGGAYGNVAHRLCPEGFAVCAPDVRGHGASGGERGRLVSERALLRDLSCLLDALRDRYDDPRIFLIGDSMGSLLALSYARTCPHELAGVVLLAPPLELRARQLLSKETIETAKRALHDPDGAVDLVGVRLDDCSADDAFKSARRTDELALKHVGTDYVMVLGAMAASWLRKGISLEVPLLILQGSGDAFVTPGAARRFHSALLCEDKHLTLVPGAHHTLLWDERTADVLDTASEWLARHSSTRGTG